MQYNHTPFTTTQPLHHANHQAACPRSDLHRHGPGCLPGLCLVEEEGLFIFNYTIEGPRTPVVKP